MEPESPLPYSQVPATCPYSEPAPSSPHNPLPLPEDLLRDTPPRNTPPPGDPSGWVVYLRIVLSPEEASRLVNIT
jgi:hypothetical protein